VRGTLGYQLKHAAKHVVVYGVLQVAIVLLSGYVSWRMAGYFYEDQRAAAAGCFLLLVGGFGLYMQLSSDRDHWKQVYFDLRRRADEIRRGGD
jgi:hypothetical protein